MTYQPYQPPRTAPVVPRMVATRILEQYKKSSGMIGMARSPSGAPAARPNAPPADPAMTDARTVLGDMQRILGILSQRGEAESSQFNEVQGLVKQLNDTMRQAREQPRAAGPAPVPVAPQPAPRVPAAASPAATGPLPATNAPLPAASSQAPLPPIKATLGMAGRAGVVYTGPEVRVLQDLLVRLGFNVPSSGTFDARTAAAIKEFQQRNQLMITGMVGAETRKALNEMMAQV